MMCGFCCIAFIEYIVTKKTLLDYTNLFSSNDYKNNDKIIYKYLKEIYDKRRHNPSIKTLKMDETRNYLLEEINHNELISKEYKKACINLNYA